MYPTIYQGNVQITTSTEPATYGTGNLQVDDNLLVLGSTSEHRVTNLFTQDNIIGLNQPPAAPGYDSGWLAARDITDVISGTPTETGTAQAGGVNTITLALTANPAINYYNNWVVLITGGPGAGEYKVITAYSGPTFIATVASNWTVQPTLASTYSLFCGANVGIVWCEAADELQAIATPNTSFDLVVTPTCFANLHVNQIITNVPNTNNRDVAPIIVNRVKITSPMPDEIGYFDWDFAELSSVSSAKLFYSVTVPGGKTATVEVYNITTATVLGTDTQAVSGFYKFAFTLPIANANLAIRAFKNLAGGPNPIINSASIILNPVT